VSRLQHVLLWVMGIFYAASGVIHLVDPAFYLPMMPPYLPWHLGLIYLSGLAELVLGVAVLVPATRRVAAWGIILLLVAVFPANLHIALHDVPLGGRAQGFGVWNWIRLPFQTVFIAWAWWYTLSPLPVRPRAPASGYGAAAWTPGSLPPSGSGRG
jgi:uncharacterized membrane protein